MKTKEDWVTELGNGVWASDIEKVQRDAFEAGAKQMRSDIYEEVYAQFMESTGLNAGTPIIVREMVLPVFPGDPT